MFKPLRDEKRYIDLVKFIGKNGSHTYTDFEGMADPEGIIERAEWAVEHVCPKSYNADEERATLKTLLIHYLYTALDTGDYKPDDTTTVEITSAIHMVISCRYFLKEDAK